MEIIINGANGRMGRILTEAIQSGTLPYRVAARIDPAFDTGGDRYSALGEFDGPADVVIDFSSHLAAKALTQYCSARNLPVVIAATGQTREELDLIRQAAERIPVFLSANLSLGVALLADLAKKAAAFFPDADIEIIESHHNRKLDVPSGTALLLAERIKEAREASGAETRLVIGRHENGRRSAGEIGIHSLRYGNEVGTHEIIISTGSETVTLRHDAEDRALFAQGALAAAAFLVEKKKQNQNGLYDMRDLIS